MKPLQKEIFDNRLSEWTIMLDQIDGLCMPDKWLVIFTNLCLDRGFRSLDDTQLSQMRNIAEVDSGAVEYLAMQDKRAGLNMLEKISVLVDDEKVRLEAVQIILEKGIKASEKELDTIIETAARMRNLFSELED